MGDDYSYLDPNMAGFYKKWEIPLLAKFLNSEVEFTTAQAHQYLVGHGVAIGRASVIQSLKRMAVDGILQFREDTGLGGTHRVYSKAITKDEFLQQLRVGFDKLYEELDQSLQGKVNERE